VHALATLILVLTTAGSTVEVPLQARLVVQHRRVAPASQPALAARYSPSWIVIESYDLSGASARSGGPTWQSELALDWVARQPGVEITVRMKYLADVRVDREALELRLPAEAVRAVWRDGRLRAVPAGTPLRIDRWTPRVAALRARGVPLLIEGVDAEGMEVRREGRQAVVVLELDDAANHPFRVEPACRTRWRGAGKGVPEGARLRLKGEEVTYRARLDFVETPLLVERLGQGRRAAVVFSDHADQTSAATFDVLLHGAGPRAPGAPAGGFLGRGLPLTKALFWRNEPGLEQLESAAVRRLAAELRAGGGEIALHSATPEIDARARTEEALRSLRDLEPRTWIDHQPPTNCEAFSNRGWRSDPEHGIVDLLAAAGIRYVWAPGGEPKPKDHFNLLRPGEPATRTPFFYPWAAPTREGRAAGLHLFRSAWAYIDRPRFLQMMSPARLDRLVDERGVAILHTYLEAIRPGRRLRPRDLMHRDAAGVVTLDAGFDAVLRDLAARQQDGRLWVTTVRDLGDQLRAVAGLEVRYDRDGTAWVRNRGDATVRGVTLSLPAPGAALEVPRASGGRADPDGPLVWGDLAPGSEAHVKAFDAAKAPLPFARPLAVKFKEKR
jgi:hypothetical protein